MAGPPRILDANAWNRLVVAAGAEDADVLASTAELEALHAGDLGAGAAVVRTATQALGRWRMNHAGQWDRFAAANTACCRAAVEAREASPEALVAGTIGPVREAFEPMAVPAGQVVEMEVVEQAILLAPHVDLLMCLDMSTAGEAAAAVTTAATTGRPVWVSLAVAPEEPAALVGGEPVAEAARLVAAAGPDAILVSARSPENAGPAVEALMACELAGTVLRGVVADAFERSPDGTVAELAPRAFAEFARRWMAAGVDIMAADRGATTEHVAALSGLIQTEWR